MRLAGLGAASNLPLMMIMRHVRVARSDALCSAAQLMPDSAVQRQSGWKSFSSNIDLRISRVTLVDPALSRTNDGVSNPIKSIAGRNICAWLEMSA